MRKHYRIVKKYYKDSNATLQYSFFVQEYVKSFWTRKRYWKTLEMQYHTGYDSFSEYRAFDTFEKAETFVKNLLRPLPPDPILAAYVSHE